MAQTNPSPHAGRFTGPRRPRYTALTEARRDSELPAGEFEIVHPTSRPQDRNTTARPQEDRQP